jgi:hypothetical protein
MRRGAAASGDCRSSGAWLCALSPDQQWTACLTSAGACLECYVAGFIAVAVRDCDRDMGFLLVRHGKVGSFRFGIRVLPILFIIEWSEFAFLKISKLN